MHTTSATDLDANDVAEDINRALVECVRCMQSSSACAKNYR